MKKCVLFFSGQVPDYAGMEKELCSNFLIADEIYKEAMEYLGYDLRKMRFEGNYDKLQKFQYNTIFTLVTNYANYKTLVSEIGVVPTVGVGYAWGQISTLLCSGIIKYKEAIDLICRSRLSWKEEKKYIDNKAVVIEGMDKGIVSQLCDDIGEEEKNISILCYHSPNEVLVYGNEKKIDILLKRLEGKEVKNTFLKSDDISQMLLMNFDVATLESILSKHSNRKFEWPVLSNITGQPFDNPEEVVDWLINEITGPIHWTKVMSYIKSNTIHNTIEISTGNLLSNISKKNMKYLKTYCFDNKKDMQDLSESVKELDYSFPGRCLGYAVSCKNSNWNEENYKAGVIKPYRELKTLCMKLEKSNTELDEEHIKTALDYLKMIISTKKVSPDRQEEILREVITVSNINLDLNKFGLS